MGAGSVRAGAAAALQWQTPCVVPVLLAVHACAMQLLVAMPDACGLWMVLGLLWNKLDFVALLKGTRERRGARALSGQSSR
jgi:hypothetical protein